METIAAPQADPCPFSPCSFCLCLNRALNPTKTLEVGGSQDGWEGAPLLMPASSSLGPLKFQDLSMHCRSPGLCIYLDPEESERLGMPGPLHFRYKQARLQALETMANILKQRIDVLTDKLHRSEAMDALVGPGPGPLPSGSSTPACPRALVPNVGQGAPWDWAELRARPLLSTPGFPDTETVRWSPGWERLQSASPRARHASEPIGRATPGPAGSQGTPLSPCPWVSSPQGGMMTRPRPLSLCACCHRLASTGAGVGPGPRLMSRPLPAPPPIPQRGESAGPLCLLPWGCGGTQGDHLTPCKAAAPPHPASL